MASRLNTSDLLDGVRGFFSSLRLTLVESIFLVAAILFASFVAFFYLTKIQPRYSEIADLKARLKTAEMKILEQSRQADALKRQREHKENILESLTDFEEMLKDRVTGHTQMITEINHLARAHSLMTPGFTYQPKGSELAEATPALPPAAEPGSSPAPAPPLKLNRDLSVYPSLGIDTAVEGDYRNLRKFIYDLERSRQFLIISAVAFQGVDEKTRQIKGRVVPSAIGNVPDPGTQNIALKIELDAYFQKPEGMRAFIYPATAAPSPAARTSPTQAPGTK
jgi:hypothetical protein